MGIALVRLPAYEVNLIIYTGRIEPDDGVRFYRAMDPDDPANAPRLLTYIDENADFSGIPMTAFPETKHALIPLLKRLSRRPGFCSAIVCGSTRCEPITYFWRAYVEDDPEYVSHPSVFRNLKDACDWLKLPEAGCEAAAAAIRARLEPPPGERAAHPEGGPPPGSEGPPLGV